MKITASHILFLVTGVIAGFVLFNVYNTVNKPAPVPGTAAATPADVSAKQPAAPPAKPNAAQPAPKKSEQEFLKEVHKLEKDTTAPKKEEGSLPPQNADQTMVPVIQLEPADKLDFGTVGNKEPSTGQVKVLNKGKADLIISQVKTSCGCTKATIADKDKTVPPGGESVISVAVNPFAIKGFESTKRLTVNSNDPKNPTIGIDVTAKFEKEFVLEPEKVDFGAVEKGTPATASLILKQVGDEAIEIQSVEAFPKQDDTLQFSFEKRSEVEWAAPGKPEYKITVTLSDTVSPGTLNKRFQIRTTCKRVPMYVCEVHGDVKSFYTLTPLAMTIFATPNAPNKGANTITLNGQIPIEVSDLASTVEGVQLASKPGEQPNSVVITADLPADTAIPRNPANPTERITFSVKGGDKVVKDGVTLRIIGGRPSPMGPQGGGPQGGMPGMPPTPIPPVPGAAPGAVPPPPSASIPPAAAQTPPAPPAAAPAAPAAVQ